ncbi:MAG: ABC-type transport system, multidrug-familypermease [Anaerocolumna sp.]|jgi:fluoroquinolone transport system permease protein|nr:ABC-type transport system, multidrug-familypermease [Anaerocolumna sp.]
MRLLRLTLGEFYFQFKYGILLLYCLITVVYLCVLGMIPQGAKITTAVILVFTDPAAMGLFFLGAVVLLEKSQRVNCSLAVTPIKVSEYILAKVIAFMITGTIVGGILCIFAGIEQLFFALLGTALSSVLFSLCGLLIAVKIHSLNQFLLATVPLEIVLCIPAFLYLFNVIRSPFMLIHPGVAAIELLKNSTDFWYLCIISLVFWIGVVFYISKKATAKFFAQMGGVKL